MRVTKETETASQVKGGRLLVAREVADATGLSVETLAQWRSQKRGIPYIKISRNCVRYRQMDLDSWLVERTVLTDQNRSEQR
jgi:predicted DNA-binding transcriptional regulator AlpA